MQRIEPTIGAIDLEVDPEQRARARAAAKRQRLVRGLVNWLVALTVLALVFGGGVALAVHRGAMANPMDMDPANLPGKIVVAGVAVLYLAQLVAAVLAFRVSAVAGMLSLLIPGYLLLALRRAGFYWPVVGMWLLGLAGIVGGMALID